MSQHRIARTDELSLGRRGRAHARRAALAVTGIVGLAGALSAGCARPAPKAPAGSDVGDEPARRLEDAEVVLAAIVGDGEPSRIPARVAKRAQCVGVVPGLVHGALLVGAKYGRGVVTCRTEGGWSAPAFFTVTGGTAGFEIGVQSIDIVMLAMSDRGRDAFSADEVRLGGDVSATAGPEGRGRSEDTDTSLQAAIVSYSHGRGLFAGANLSGAVVRADAEATRAFYGHDEAVATTLRRPAVPPSPADRFLARVRSAF